MHRFCALLLAATAFGFVAPATSLPVDGVEEYCFEQKNQISCTGPVDEFGCDTFQRPPTLLNSLEPAAPLLVCGRRSAISGPVPRGIITLEGVGWTAGWRFTSSYIVKGTEHFRHLQSAAAFRQVYAPVTSADEAVAFVVALGLGEVVADTTELQNREGGTYAVNPQDIQPSEVEILPDGFLITAYSNVGLCAMEIVRREIKIARDGQTEILRSTLVWRRNYPCIY